MSPQLARDDACPCCDYTHLASAVSRALVTGAIVLLILAIICALAGLLADDVPAGVAGIVLGALSSAAFAASLPFPDLMADRPADLAAQLADVSDVPGFDSKEDR